MLVETPRRQFYARYYTFTKYYKVKKFKFITNRGIDNIITNLFIKTVRQIFMQIYKTMIICIIRDFIVNY